MCCPVWLCLTECEKTFPQNVPMTNITFDGVRVLGAQSEQRASYHTCTGNMSYLSGSNGTGNEISSFFKFDRLLKKTHVFQGLQVVWPLGIHFLCLHALKTKPMQNMEIKIFELTLSDCITVKLFRFFRRLPLKCSIENIFCCFGLSPFLPPPDSRKTISCRRAPLSRNK